MWRFSAPQQRGFVSKRMQALIMADLCSKPARVTGEMTCHIAEEARLARGALLQNGCGADLQGFLSSSRVMRALQDSCKP